MSTSNNNSTIITPPTAPISAAEARTIIDEAARALAPGGRFVELGKRGILSAAEVAQRRPDVTLREEADCYCSWQSSP